MLKLNKIETEKFRKEYFFAKKFSYIYNFISKQLWKGYRAILKKADKSVNWGKLLDESNIQVD